MVLYLVFEYSIPLASQNFQDTPFGLTSNVEIGTNGVKPVSDHKALEHDTSRGLESL